MYKRLIFMTGALLFYELTVVDRGVRGRLRCEWKLILLMCFSRRQPAGDLDNLASGSRMHIQGIDNMMYFGFRYAAQPTTPDCESLGIER